MGVRRASLGCREQRIPGGCALPAPFSPSLGDFLGRTGGSVLRAALSGALIGHGPPWGTSLALAELLAFHFAAGVQQHGAVSSSERMAGKS